MGSFGGLELDVAAAWALTRALSTREVVRVGSIAADDGTVSIDFDREVSVSAMVPSTPWAMYLSADRERYDWLAFEFDASRGNAVYDAFALALWLDEHRIDHLMTEVAPVGGRQIWIALDAPVPADAVAEIAELASSLLPSLDVRALLDPAGGCVCPPGAIAPYNGVSQPLGAGALSALNRPVGGEHLELLRDYLLELGGTRPDRAESTSTPPAAEAVADGRWEGDTRGAAWDLTALMSPRASVQELTDPIENLYAATRAIAGVAPERPWAMHLANAQGYFRWVCFDLDSSKGNTRKDAKRLTHWLGALGIFSLECVSGPSGGRHVWIAVDLLHPQMVNTVAILAKQLLPTLDTTPLSARGNGAVRPPLTPHRKAGFSRPLGDVDALLNADPVDAATFRLLEQLLEAEGAVLPMPALAGARGVVTDAHGVRYLAGGRRTPSARIQGLLDGTSSQLSEFSDLSQLQWVVLTGLAYAKWRFDDVTRHLRSSPAFEHSRSIPVGGRRVPRTRRDPRTVLRNDWVRAVDFVAANPVSHAGTDSEYVARIVPLIEAVEATQARADAVPGFWGHSDTSRGARAHAGRPSWRSVLDAVCVYILRSARTDPQINIRRLAADTGYSHRACELALQALTRDDQPWLQRTEEGEGRLAARYQLHPRVAGTPTEFSTDPYPQKLPQGITPPPTPASDTSRLKPLLRTLTTRLQTLNRDLFSARGSLGRRAGRVFQDVSEEWATTEQVAGRSRSSVGRVRMLLQVLHRAGVVKRGRRGWSRVRDEVVGVLDAACATAGYLAQRRLRYRAEGVQWRWLLAEMTWLRLPRKQKRRRPAAVPALLPLSGVETPYPAYPRLPDRKLDHQTAYQLALAGAIDEHRSLIPPHATGSAVA